MCAKLSCIHKYVRERLVGIFDDIRAKGAAYRLTEESLYAEALREIESGQRRDGIWAKAMAESNMDQGKAGAKYIKLRVQSLKDEVALVLAECQRADATRQQISRERQAIPFSSTPPKKPIGFLKVILFPVFVGILFLGLVQCTEYVHRFQ